MRVMLVDDHRVVRTALATLLRQEPDIDIVGEAGDGERAIEMARDLRPDVIMGSKPRAPSLLSIRPFE
jgi:DNA-binding NarL/FixJ family response regulator